VKCITTYRGRYISGTNGGLIERICNAAKITYRKAMLLHYTVSHEAHCAQSMNVSGVTDSEDSARNHRYNTGKKQKLYWSGSGSRGK
jgi:hypothetical protein